ncbi:hypothetical protein NIES4103_03030 [Nostoc sp. NIES-4103]|nr:hypothetical protein NIES4103_03030 [Nostoc sp. NIES-4103]
MTIFLEWPIPTIRSNLNYKYYLFLKMHHVLQAIHELPLHESVYVRQHNS